MRNKNLRESFLNGEILFEKYFSMGAAANMPRLLKFAISSGMKDSKGNEPTKMGVWKAMWRWASLQENKARAYEIFSEYVDEHGWVWDTEYEKESFDKAKTWHTFMLQKIKSAWQHPTESAYNRFLLKNGWIS